MKNARGRRIIDVAGPLNAILAKANERFDAAIWELSDGPRQLEITELKKQLELESNPFYWYGALTRQFQDAVNNMADAFALGFNNEGKN